MDHLFLQGTLLDIYSIFSLNRDSFFSSSDLIIEDPFPNASKNFQNLERENENNINFPRSLKGFRIGHINIASLVKHIDELKIYLEKEPSTSLVLTKVDSMKR